MSFDDGPEQDKRLIRMLKDYGLKCTFNLNSGLLGENRWVARLGEIGFASVKDKNRFPASLFMGADCNIIPIDEVAQVYKGFEVASHGRMHKILKYMDEKKLYNDISSDVRALENLTGNAVYGHVYPFGLYNDKAIKCLGDLGIKYARTAKSTHSFSFPDNSYLFDPTCACFDKSVFELLESFIRANPQEEDIIFCLWGHSYEFDFETERNSWERIEKIVRKIAGHDDIIYCTNCEVFDRKNKGNEV